MASIHEKNIAQPIDQESAAIAENVQYLKEKAVPEQQVGAPPIQAGDKETLVWLRSQVQNVGTLASTHSTEELEKLKSACQVLRKNATATEKQSGLLSRIVTCFTNGTAKTIEKEVQKKIFDAQKGQLMSYLSVASQRGGDEHTQEIITLLSSVFPQMSKSEKKEVMQLFLQFGIRKSDIPNEIAEVNTKEKTKAYCALCKAAFSIGQLPQLMTVFMEESERKGKPFSLDDINEFLNMEGGFGKIYEENVPQSLLSKRQGWEEGAEYKPMKSLLDNEKNKLSTMALAQAVVREQMQASLHPKFSVKGFLSQILGNEKPSVKVSIGEVTRYQHPEAVARAKNIIAEAALDTIQGELGHSNTGENMLLNEARNIAKGSILLQIDASSNGEVKIPIPKSCKSNSNAASNLARQNMEKEIYNNLTYQSSVLRNTPAGKESSEAVEYQNQLNNVDALMARVRSQDNSVKSQIYETLSIFANDTHTFEATRLKQPYETLRNLFEAQRENIPGNELGQMVTEFVLPEGKNYLLILEHLLYQSKPSTENYTRVIQLFTELNIEMPQMEIQEAQKEDQEEVRLQPILEPIESSKKDDIEPVESAAAAEKPEEWEQIGSMMVRKSPSNNVPEDKGKERSASPDTSSESSIELPETLRTIFEEPKP